MLGGGGGSGVSGGGMAGGRAMAAMLRLGARPLSWAIVWAWTRSVSMPGLDCKLLGVGTIGLDVRRPGTNEGVDATARTGREFKRKGAGLFVRTCTDVGRRLERGVCDDE